MKQRIVRSLSPPSEGPCRPAGPDPGDAHDTNWESAWIDLGGEG